MTQAPAARTASPPPADFPPWPGGEGRARLSTPLLLVLAAALCVLVGYGAYRGLFTVALDHENRLAAQRLDGFALSLEATLSRHESLPGLFALDPALSALLKEPGNPARVAAANAYLEAAQQGAAVAQAYLLDTRGLTLAASNWRLPQSFVGHNYAFRPYFRHAVEKGLSRFYGVGATTGEPGYFLAAPVREGARVLGVIVLKIGLESIEQALAGAGDKLLLVDGDGIVFLAADRNLRYRALAPLAAPVLARLADTQQYGGYPIALLANRPLPLEGAEPVTLALPGQAPRARRIHARPVGRLGWRIVALEEVGEARATALGGGIAAAFGLAFALGLALHLRHRAERRAELRQARHLAAVELEERIALRTGHLTEQVAALERTEAILRATRDAAVQAGKLAVLGQMSAGITHELNQPLAALLAFADNARALMARGRLPEAEENLVTISELVARTSGIVRQLKSFARKEDATPGPVAVAAAVAQACLMVGPRARELNARIEVAVPDTLQALAGVGRLEQVLVNLLRNGLDAMAGQTAPVLRVAATALDTPAGEISLTVADQGPGLAPDTLAHLFEPFYTTKAPGEGLGLGLALSLAIVEGYGGSLSAHNPPQGGATFEIRLPGPPPSTP